MTIIVMISVVAGCVCGAVEAAHIRRRREFDRRLARWHDEERICNDIDD
jgi:hypothetical protein